MNLGELLSPEMTRVHNERVEVTPLVIVPCPGPRTPGIGESRRRSRLAASPRGDTGGPGLAAMFRANLESVESRTQPCHERCETITKTVELTKAECHKKCAEDLMFMCCDIVTSRARMKIGEKM